MDTDIASAMRGPLLTPESGGSARAAVVALRTDAGGHTSVLTRPGVDPEFGPDAAFLTYSITKSFAATAALRLCASGELALDAPVGRWIPSAPHAVRITPRQLLQHTSGLPDYGALGRYHASVRRGGEPWSESDFLDRTRADELLFEPGEGWAYSNTGYMLVRRLLETVRGQAFGRVLQTEIIEPLGLESTFVPTDEDLRHLTFGPSPSLGGDGPPVDVKTHYRVGWIATGVVASTASEVARFYHALFAGDLLPHAFLEEMRSARLLDPLSGRPFEEPGYGLGLQLDAGSCCGEIWGHSGGGPGSSAAAYHCRDGCSPVTVAVLSDGEDLRQVEKMAVAGIAAACG